MGLKGEDITNVYVHCLYVVYDDLLPGHGHNTPFDLYKLNGKGKQTAFLLKESNKHIKIR